MTEGEYLSGVANMFDGEGGVSLWHNNGYRSPSVYITQQGQQAYLEELKVRWGGCVVLQPSVDYWKLDSAPSIKRFLTDIYPWLRFKRAEALHIIAYCSYVAPVGKNLYERDKLARAVIARKFDEIKKSKKDRQRRKVSGLYDHQHPDERGREEEARELLS